MFFRERRLISKKTKLKNQKNQAKNQKSALKFRGLYNFDSLKDVFANELKFTSKKEKLHSP